MDKSNSEIFGKSIKPIDFNIYFPKEKFKKEKHVNPKDSWEKGFSDPRYHDDKNFRYSVYAFQGDVGETLQVLFSLNQELKGGTSGVGRDIDLKKQPSRVSEITLLSTSIIDEQKRETFGPVGLILSSPYENVLDMSPEDIGTNFAKPEVVIKNSKRITFTLDNLMEKTSETNHNEVRIRGTTEAGKITVTGFWYKVDSKGLPLNQELFEEMRRLSYLHQLPLVRIKEVDQQPFLDSKAHVHTMSERDRPGKDFKLVEVPFGIGVNRDGFRYFYDFKRKTIDKLDQDRRRLPFIEADFQFFKTIVLNELSAKDQAEVAVQLDQMDKIYEDSQKHFAKKEDGW